MNFSSLYEEKYTEPFDEIKGTYGDRHIGYSSVLVSLRSTSDIHLDRLREGSGCGTGIVG